MWISSLCPVGFVFKFMYWPRATDQWECYGISWNVTKYFIVLQNTINTGILPIIVIPLYSKILQNFMKCSKVFKIFQNIPNNFGMF